ncbi:MAG: polysaccharide deacetylase family protein, partial [Erysipelotrichaceae bacterium]|nr:polysaccharide deacetylase family protein [Erysipelotrichaceae bacterium]
KKIISLISVLMIVLSGCAGRKTSRHEDALMYENGECVVFYPDNENIKKYAESLCSDKEDRKIDYKVKEAGDFYIVSYPDGLNFYTEKDYSDPDLSVRNDLDILSDELRYQMRESGIDEAYTSRFFLNTAKDALNVHDISVRVNGEDMYFYFPDYDYEVVLPIELGQRITERNFGRNDAEYVKRRYIDPDRPMVALTFDDGPYRVVDSVIYETMERYDARCTFYFVGSRLTQKELDNSLTGIAIGCEYGSHTENHENLADYDAQEAKEKIFEVSDYFNEKLGYQMKTYRPPFGTRNKDMEEIIDMTAILWNVDSLDWKYRDSYTTYQSVMGNVTPNDVVLMHSLYESTGEALKWIVPDLMDEGYQLVTVSELMEYLQIDSKVFGGK